MKTFSLLKEWKGEHWHLIYNVLFEAEGDEFPISAYLCLNMGKVNWTVAADDDELLLSYRKLFKRLRKELLKKVRECYIDVFQEIQL